MFVCATSVFDVRTDSGADPYFSSVVLLLHGIGANNSTTITDNSTSNKTVTAQANAKISTTSPPSWSTSSIYLDGTDDGLVIANAQAVPSLEIGASQDFTYEAWVNILTQGYSYSFLFGFSYGLVFSTGLVVTINNSGGGVIVANCNGGTFSMATSGHATLVNAGWSHIAVCRSGSTMTIYVNGVARSTGTYSGALPAPSGKDYLFGRDDWYSSNNLTGYFADVRFTKGVCRYTGTFTPPTVFPNF